MQFDDRSKSPVVQPPFPKSFQGDINMYCINVLVGPVLSSAQWEFVLIPQARLADTYVTLLLAINSASEFGHQQVVHVAFAPPQHILQASTSSSRQCKVYFCISKGISFLLLKCSIHPLIMAMPPYIFLPQYYLHRTLSFPPRNG